MNGRTAASRVECAQRRGHVVALVAMVVGVPIGGCANGRVSDQDTARGTAQTFLAQCAAGRSVRVIEVLNRSARTDFIDAGGASAGCAAVLGAPRAAPPAMRRLRDASLRLTRFDGARASFEVDAAMGHMHLDLANGAEGWLIEGPA
jgi:hypothetical protein